MDDIVIGAKTTQDLKDAVELLKDNVDLELVGTLADYVGVHVDQQDDTMVFSQPSLIDSILEDLGLNDSSKTHPTPSLSSSILHADLEGEDHDGHFDYRSVIGKLNYLTKSTRPDICYAVHQCSRFMSNPKRSHAMAVKRIGRYLLRTRDRGFVARPDPSRGFECYVDASFCGEWDKDRAEQATHDPNTARSRTGFVIMFAGVPLTWSSRLQTEITLSSTEAEMVALSAATRENIFMWRLIMEASQLSNLDLPIDQGKIHCSVFEDNMGTIELAKEFRLRPRTKHINVKHWHFNQFMKEHEVVMTIQWVPSDAQVANIMTKHLALRLRKGHLQMGCPND